jgi:spore coat polysaccharide biosynthesis predicted glycosyltransferase SpsG
MLRQEFATTPPAELREKVSDILVTMGGSDPNNFTPKVLNALAPLENVCIHVACGSMMKNINDIKAEAKKCLSRVILYSPPDSMAELMQKCDLAISAGGGTVKELFVMGLVSLFIIQADNQLPLKDYLHKVKLPLYLGSYRDVTSEQIYAETLKLINNHDERTRIRTQILHKVDRMGVSNIVRELKLYCMEGKRS